MRYLLITRQLISSELKELPEEARMNFLISEEEYKFIYNPSPLLSTFYALFFFYCPVPGRPIVSGCNNLTQEASVYIDTILRPFVTTLSSYLHNMKDVVTKLHEIVVHDGVYLASLDVESLYTNITHDLGIESIKLFLDTRNIYLQYFCFVTFTFCTHTECFSL